MMRQYEASLREVALGNQLYHKYAILEEIRVDLAYKRAGEAF